jgi:hypothetical protein
MRQFLFDAASWLPDRQLKIRALVYALAGFPTRRDRSHDALVAVTSRGH